MPRLVINLSRETIDAQANETVWAAQDAVRRLRGRAALSEIGRHDRVRLVVDDIDGVTSARPVLAARALTLGAADIADTAGRTRPIGWASVGAIGARAAWAAATWPSRRARLLRRLARIPGPQAVFAPGTGVLAVRGDLWFAIKAGGAVAHTAGILNELARTSSPVRLLAPTAIPMLTENVEVVRVRRSQTWSPSGVAAAAAYNDDLVAAARALPTPRFVYARNALFSIAGLEIARACRAPFVIEFNGPEAWVAHHWGEPVPHGDIAEEIEAAMLRKADLVSVVSAPLRDWAIERGVAPERIYVSPNGVDAHRFHPAIDGGRIRARFGLSERPVIGFIGTFGVWHGADLIAAAAARLGGRANLLMIGDGPHAGVAKAAAAALGPCAAFTGLVDQVDGPEYLAACDILVSPTLPNPDGSRFFGSPTKLFEYMAMGRAIVASDLDQIGEILVHEESALLTKPGDLESLAAALDRLVGDAALRARIGARARADAEAYHTWSARVAGLTERVAALRNSR